MWGATLPRAKLTGDSGSPFEAALICDLRSFRALAENQPLCLLGLLQHYPPNSGHPASATTCPLSADFVAKVS